MRWYHVWGTKTRLNYRNGKLVLDVVVESAGHHGIHEEKDLQIMSPAMSPAGTAPTPLAKRVSTPVAIPDDTDYLTGLFSLLDDAAEPDENCGFQRRFNRVTVFRQRFHRLDRDHSKTLSLDEILNSNVLSPRTNLEEVNERLLQETIKFRFRGIRLGDDDELTIDEWVHYKMLRASAPSWIALEGINRQLSRSLRTNSQLVSRMVSAFESGDVNLDGKIPQDLWPSIFRPLIDGEAGVREICKDVDLNADRSVDYYEFATQLLVGERQEVQLAMYDISNGMANYIPAALLSGHKFKYIYHTGILVFGREYWYGGGVFASTPGTTPFGEPVKVEKLGMTVRTKVELMKYITDHLRWQYTYATYDVLHHNCNCFSNDVSQFLLDGQDIPDEVRKQPEWAEQGVGVQAIRPILNHYLGGFGQDDDKSYGRLDDVTDLWRSRLRKGDLVMWQRRFIDLPDIMCIDKLDDAAGTVIGHIFSVTPGASAPSQVSKGGVPLRELHPVPGLPTSDVLARNRLKPMPPSCALSHPLESYGRFNLFKPSPCSMCKKDLPRRLVCCANGEDLEPLHCKRCNFTLCGECVAEGCKLGGGVNGGVFSDILTIPLAADVIKSPGWLRFKAQQYFERADQDETERLDSVEIEVLGSRLWQELGLRQGSEEWDAFCKVAQVLDWDLFQAFFKRLLIKASQRSSFLVS